MFAAFKCQDFTLSISYKNSAFSLKYQLLRFLYYFEKKNKKKRILAIMVLDKALKTFKTLKKMN